jgi:hypothetical protein
MMTSETNKKHSSADLESIYRDAESVDSDIFPEMRSNLLLIAGDHYSKKTSSFFRRVRDSKDLSDQQKIRLTKNHTQKIHKTYVNNIISMAPGVGFEPKNESELQDQKSAELHHAVWQDAVDKYDLHEKIDDWCDDFCAIGEVHTKIFWDPSQGEIVGYNQKVDAEGQGLFHDHTGEETAEYFNQMTGQPNQLAPDESSPVYSGQFVFEEVYGFNLLRAPEAKTLKSSPYLIIRKMVNRQDLLKQFPGEEYAKKIVAGQDETYTIFDSMKKGYSKTKTDVLVKEYYFRPCPQYPKGYFFIATKEGILHEDELPGGIFPIVSGFMEKYQTTPRGRAAIKQARPYQAEINRAASKMAEHQITLGDDKLIVPNGTTVSSGIALPGVRSINVNGAAPTVMQGRDGSQYLDYMNAQIAEMYQIMNVAEDSAEKENGQLDPYALLFRAASQKKGFQRYVRRFERFLIDVAQTYIRLAKIYLPDEQVIYAIGKSEAVNISEFKNQSDICYQIKVVPQNDDIETKMGKQLILNHALQYTANKLEKEDIGKLMRAMPYGNFEESFDDLTIDYDSSTDDLLALDRGQMPVVNENDNHVYSIKRATSRQRKRDFAMLAPQIQQNYKTYIAQHQQFEAQRLYQIQLAESGLIPTGGYLVSCDFYVNDPKNPGKTTRAKLPYQAVQWLIDKLGTQGQGQEELESMDQQSQGRMAMALQPQGPGALNGMSAQGPAQGQASPGGDSHGGRSGYGGLQLTG